MARRPIDAPVVVTTEFGVADSYAKFGKHSGVDYAKATGSQVKAPIGGVITYAQYHNTGGNMVQLFDGQFYHRLMHNKSLNVVVGQRVNEGDLVALSNSTGLSTGPQVHWDISTESNPSSFATFRDPDLWLQGAYKSVTPTPTPSPSLQPHQRLLTNSDVNQRSLPDHNSAILQNWKLETGANADNVYNFKGWVRGTDPYGNGNNIWFVGAKSGGYFYSGAFQGGANTAGLPDLNTVPVQPTNPDPVIPDPVVPDPLITRVINKKNPNSPIDYAPTDLTAVGNAQYLRAAAAKKFNEMINAASAGGAPLTPGSGYRSYAVQKTVYDSYVAKDGQALADTYSARPGYSEHQTGLTMDFIPIEDSFAGTKQDKWLQANAHKYGFVLRYPADKTSITGYMYEPWHYRFIGVDPATEMKEKGITTLEEYYGVPGGLYQGQDNIPIDDHKYEERLNKIELSIIEIKATLKKITDFLSGIFKNF